MNPPNIGGTIENLAPALLSIGLLVAVFKIGSAQLPNVNAVIANRLGALIPPTCPTGKTLNSSGVCV